MPQNDVKMCGIKHIVIPASDPQNQVKPQQIQNFVGQIVTHLQKNPNDFGAIAYNYSLDPKKVTNQPLQNCLNGVPKTDAKAYQDQATQCLTKHVGELDCFKTTEQNPAWVSKVNSMKPGTVDSIFLKDQNVFSIIQKPLK